MYLNGWIRVVVSVSAALAFVSSAAVRADLTPIGPFTGELFESWETFPTSAPENDYLPDPTSIMGGAATISSPRMVIFEPGVLDCSLGSSGYAVPSDGIKGMGLGGSSQSATITFAQPVRMFGAYWGAFTIPGLGLDPAIVNLTFRDASGVILTQTSFEYSHTVPHDGVLDWHGWETSVPIGSLAYSGTGVVIDALSASLVPEPGTLSLIAIAILLPRRKRCVSADRQG